MTITIPPKTEGKPTIPEISVDGNPIVDPEQMKDIEKFEVQLAKYRSGELDPDVFRVFRLTNGIYGQRQGGDNQMVRVKIPSGIMTPDQMDMLAHIAETYSRGWGHITTRQNIQLHFIQLDDIPAVLRKFATVGLGTREACGDTVRNIQSCHLAGACPHEVLDTTAWAQATYLHFIRNPIAQRLPRKFKINFSGCATDCGQAMFNDVGVIATTRKLEDGTSEAGFRVFMAGGLGANPHPAQLLEPFTPREELLSTIEACVRVFDHYGNRENNIRARMKWLVEELGLEQLKENIKKERKFLLASSSWPGGIPQEVQEKGDAPAGKHKEIAATVMGQGTLVNLIGTSQYERWESVNVVRGASNGTVSAYAWVRLGDITADQFRGLANIQREFNAEVRVTNRQNLVYRQLSEEQLKPLFERLQNLQMAEPGAELARDVVACPGADTCNLAVTQSRGLADAIGARLEAEGLSDLSGIRTNISGCTNSCGQHHAFDIGFYGAERRAHNKTAPGYQMLLGGFVGDEQIHFGKRALRLPAKNVPEAVSRVASRYSNEREVSEPFHVWLDRVGGAKEVALGLKDLDDFPTPETNPEFYVDYDETGPYEVEIGESECAT